jgi:thiamine-monophosphate kinase
LKIAAPTDDAAAWQARPGIDVATVDTMVEGVDFRLTWAGFTFRRLGHRLMAINLSDLAAMGAMARFALISIALPGSTRLPDVRKLYQGIAGAGKRYGCRIAGGDISSTSGPLTLTAALVGSVSRGRSLLTRTGARAGWQLAVTGRLGAAALGLMLLEAPSRLPVTPSETRRWTRAILEPVPRLEAAQVLAGAGVRVAGDISDGLYREVARIAFPAGLGAEIDARALPLDSGMQRLERGWWAIRESEDFELICAAPPAVLKRAADRLRRRLRLPLTVVGQLTHKPGIRVLDNGREHVIEPAGYEHFRSHGL